MSSKFEIQTEHRFTPKTKFVHWSEIDFGSGKDILGTYAVGVCLAVTLYDPVTKKGGLTHIHPNNEHNPEHLYPERVLESLLKGVNGTLQDYSRLEASMVGENDHDMGGPMSEIIVQCIEEKGIQLIGRDHGQLKGWDVLLYCEDGRVRIYRY